MKVLGHDGKMQFIGEIEKCWRTREGIQEEGEKKREKNGEGRKEGWTKQMDEVRKEGISHKTRGRNNFKLRQQNDCQAFKLKYLQHREKPQRDATAGTITVAQINNALVSTFKWIHVWCASGLAISSCFMEQEVKEKILWLEYTVHVVKLPIHLWIIGIALRHSVQRWYSSMGHNVSAMLT